MKTLINIFFTTIFVLVLAHYLPGIYVKDTYTALIVAVVLGLLNIFVKPVLVFFTFPATIFTLGLFLLVINAVIVLICDYLVKGFDVANFWNALLFSLVLSFGQALISSLTDDKKEKR
ncbi:phage holin family protein [Flavobacterium sp. RHBU_3]|uniref:phage holin family protein n=1 Tax=Flavobacterium sp. RHBU_3 TaxID=3391184 RepID=UPI00398524B8